MWDPSLIIFTLPLFFLSQIALSANSLSTRVPITIIIFDIKGLKPTSIKILKKKKMTR